MNRYVRAMGYNFFYFAAGAAFFLLITPLAIKVMGQELFGLWSILSSLMLFANVGTAGIAAIVMKFSAEASEGRSLEDQVNDIMTAGFIIVLAMAFLVALMLWSAKDLL